MEVLALQAFVSLLLVVGSLLLFGFSARQRDHEHADRLALAPLDDDDAAAPRGAADNAAAPADDAPAGVAQKDPERLT